MAKKSMVEREKKRARLIARYREKRDALRRVVVDANASFEARMEAGQALQKLPRDSSMSRLRTRCALTGRPRGVYRRFGLSKTVLRLRAMNGEIAGLSKSSW